MVHAARAAVALFLFALPLHAQISSFPYLESFDLSAAVPSGWSANGFTISTTSARSAPNCLSATGKMLTKILMTPVIQLGGRTPERIAFYERRTSTALRYRLALSAVTEDLSRTFPLARWDSISAVNVYVQRSVDLDNVDVTAYSGLRFVLEILRDSTNSTGILRIDDVALTVQVGVDVVPVRVTVEPFLPVTGQDVTVSTLLRNDGRQLASSGILALRWESLGRAGGTATALWNIGGLDSTFVQLRIPSLPPGPTQLIVAATCPGDENPSNDTLRTTLDVGVGRGALVVNEIMYAPTREDEPEWIELYNPGPWSIHPGDMTVSDNSSTRVVVGTAGADSLQPGLYLVLARSADVTPLYPPFPFVVVPFPSLNNTTPDAVVIRDRAGRTIDSVWYAPAGGISNGRSLERRDWNLPSHAAATWQASEDPMGATPGRVNSVQRPEMDLLCDRLDVRRDPTSSGEAELSATIRNRGRRSARNAHVSFFAAPTAGDSIEPLSLIGTVPLVELAPEESVSVSLRWTEISSGSTRIAAVVENAGDLRPGNDTATVLLVNAYPARSLIMNEVMFESEPGQNEWVELFNPGPDPIDIGGWTLEDMPTTSGSVVRSTVPHRPVIVRSGAYAVLAAESTVTDRYPWLEDPVISVIVFGRGSGLGLNNAGDGLVLRDQTGASIDSVVISAQWHVGGIGSAGRSLERTRPHVSGTDADSWTTC
ncbi:MAG: lamin tail domain-containing protein, partial [Bacteroidota bacterium]